MGRPNRYQIMELFKDDIFKALSNKDKAILNYRDVSVLLEVNKQKWRLPYSTTANELLNFLINKGIVQKLSIESSNGIIEKYLFDKNISIYEIALSLLKDSFLSHYTAVFLHGLTNNIVKNIYITKEQLKKYPNRETNLLQSNIDIAFSKQMRKTSKIAFYHENEIYLLEGKHTGRKGVVRNTENLPITSIERTLIDIAVRPDYSGGVFEVLNAYKNAKGKASINMLSSLLKEMDFIYPYHQVIGFYLERAGYKESILRLMEKIPKKYDFYLNYNMKNPKYSERWKLFYPEGL